ncbi:MAG: PASTA domain-containing protein, partial [Clostridia bacterium]
SENGETRVIDTKEVKRRVDETPELRRRDDEKEERRGETRRKKKKSGYGVVAAVAVITAILVLVAVGMVAHTLSGKSEAEIPVPNIVGLTVEQAEAKLGGLEGDYKGFTVKVEFYENNSAEKDTILSQTPEAEEIVKGAQVIKVIVSSGPAEIVIGSYMGETYTKIERELTKKGIVVVKEEESSDNFPSGIIVRQEPESGTTLSGGDTITLYVSTGSENAVVPNVVGLSEADARTTIERSGLAVGEVVRKTNEKYVKGLVYDQGYAAFTKVPEGTKVDIFVSDGAKTGEQDTDEENNKQEVVETTKPPIVDNPSQIEEMKTKYLSLNLPTDRTKVTVKLVCDGKVIYEKEHNTSSGTADISLKSKGTISVDIYYDNEFVATKEVKFN